MTVIMRYRAKPHNRAQEEYPGSRSVLGRQRLRPDIRRDRLLAKGLGRVARQAGKKELSYRCNG